VVKVLNSGGTVNGEGGTIPKEGDANVSLTQKVLNRKHNPLFGLRSS